MLLHGIAVERWLARYRVQQIGVAALTAQTQMTRIGTQRLAGALLGSGLIEQRKGPHGGARLKLPAKQIGLGDVYLATEGDWLILGDPSISGLLKRVRAEGVLAMNETTLAQMIKRMRKKDASTRALNGSKTSARKTA